MIRRWRQARAKRRADGGEPAPIPERLLRSLFADPDHAPERLVLFAAGRLGEESTQYAQRLREANPEASARELSDRIRARSTFAGRTQGAIAGTPFLIALVPAYVAVLWEQARMTMRIAALHDRDPRDPRMPAEILAIRGVYPSVDAAAAALEALPAERGRRLRGGVRNLYRLGRRFLVVIGMLSPPREDERGWLVAVAMTGVAGVAWMLTWIFPLTFMLAMSQWGESNTREMGRRVLRFYGGPDAEDEAAAEPEARADRRRRRRFKVLVGVSVAIPLALMAAAVVHPAEAITWPRIIAALAGISLVIALFVLSTRRLPT